MSGLVHFTILLFNLMVLEGVSGVKMLFLGDLISKHFVSDWCESKRSSAGTNFYTSRNTSFSLQPWGGNLSTNSETSAVYCHDYNSDDIVASAFIYGSSDSGPYYRHPTKEIQRNSDVIKTKDRIELAVDEFIMKFGSLPEKVVLHTSIMDYLYASEKTRFNKIFDSSQSQWTEVLEKILIEFRTFDKTDSKWSDVVTTFEENTHTRITHLREIFTQYNEKTVKNQGRHYKRHLRAVKQTHSSSHRNSSNSHDFRRKLATPPAATTTMTNKQPDIILHTALWFDQGGHILKEFNQILRNISSNANNGLTLYDFDHDVWSKVGFITSATAHTKIFEKGEWNMNFYPNPRFSENNIDVLLGRQHTTSLFVHGKRRPNAMKSLTTNGESVTTSAYSGSENSADNYHNNNNNINNKDYFNVRLIRAHTSTKDVLAGVKNTDNLPGSGEIFYCNYVDGVRYKYRIGNLTADFPEIFNNRHNNNNDVTADDKNGVESNGKHSDNVNDNSNSNNSENNNMSGVEINEVAHTAEAQPAVTSSGDSIVINGAIIHTGSPVPDSSAVSGVVVSSHEQQQQQQQQQQQLQQAVENQQPLGGVSGDEIVINGVVIHTGTPVAKQLLQQSQPQSQQSHQHDESQRAALEAESGGDAVVIDGAVVHIGSPVPQHQQQQQQQQQEGQLNEQQKKRYSQRRQLQQQDRRTSAAGVNTHNNNNQKDSAKMKAFFISQEYEDWTRVALSALWIGPPELLLLPEHVVNSIPTATEHIPILFSATKNIGFTSPNVYDSSVMDLFISFAETGKYKQIPYFALFKTYQVDVKDIIHNVPRHWFYTATSKPDTTGINVYKDDTLLRYFNERSVYVIKGGVKYGFRNGQAFMSLGYDFGDVVILEAKDREYFDMIPYGGFIA